jgi:glycosyltransferase involved in cell wall biosynthesis
MFCTTIIPTVGRKSLARAVRSVLDQAFRLADHEVIVVNDSGTPLPTENWHQDERVTIIDTIRRERSIARNVGAALARGSYLHFLDDDDWMLPGALEVFWSMAHQHNDCAWFYGGAQLFDREDEPLQQLIHRLQPNCFIQVMAGEWIPLQASIISQAAFHRLGGFNPTISGPEDIDLARRIALHFDFCGSAEPVAGIEMGTANSTTNSEQAQLAGRDARELILNQPGVFTRMRTSAGNSFWYGRVVRVYLTSTIWNATRNNFLTALSRLLYGLLSFVTACPFLLPRISGRQ